MFIFADRYKFMKKKAIILFCFICLYFFVFGCSHKTKSENSSKVVLLSIYGKTETVNNGAVFFELDKKYENIKAGDIKVFAEGSSVPIPVRMTPYFILLKESDVTFKVFETENSSFKFNIEVTVRKAGSSGTPIHNGDLQIWVPLTSTDKNEAVEAMPDALHINDYILEVNYNFEEYDLPQIWVLYKKAPESIFNSTDLRFSAIADGKTPLRIYGAFPPQDSELKIPIYINSASENKIYNLIVKTKKAPESENANIKTVSFNGKPGIIEGKNITCGSVFETGSVISVEAVTEHAGASYTVNGGLPVVIANAGSSFVITVLPEKTGGIRKNYNVVLDAPPNRAVTGVNHLNFSSEAMDPPKPADLLPVQIDADGEERSVTLPLYTAAENSVLSFEHLPSLEIDAVFALKNNKWVRLEGYSSSKKMLTLREGILPLPPSTLNRLKIKILFKDKSYDSLTLKFKKPDNLQSVTILGLYINDNEIPRQEIMNYINGTKPLFEAKGPKIYVDIITKEAVSVTVDGMKYNSVYSGFLSYGLSFPINMPDVDNQKDISVLIECEYAADFNLMFNVKRLAGAVDLTLFPSINGLNVGTDLLDKFITGEKPVVFITGGKMIFTLDTKQTELAEVLVNLQPAQIKTLTDSATDEKFWRVYFSMEGFNTGEERDVTVFIKPKDIVQYNSLTWQFKVRREN